MDNRLASLRRILRIHINWLTVKLLGKELVSKEELAELKDYGRLDLGDEVGLIESSFVLGRTSALSKKSEYKDITLEKLSMLKKRKFSSIEKLAIREAKLHASRRLQILSEEAAAGAFARVNKATQDLIADATAKDIIQEELALALAEKKTRKQLATSVGNKLGADLTAGFRKLLVTEMHRAKTRGVAMAISNKVDIYSTSEGAQSIVSVVPNRGACKDCENLYLSETGDPRTFKLSDLVGQGTNADPGISHARTHGLHLGWRPVMPPAHPNCFCELVYVPAGMGWKNGKLVVVDELKYKEQISKAVDKSTMSATIKPHGAPSNQGDKTPKPGSLPKLGGDAPALDVSAHASTPEPTQQQQEPAGDSREYDYWAPKSGVPPTGEGWEQAEDSQAWRRPKGWADVGEGEDEGNERPTMSPEENIVARQKVKDYSHKEHSVAEAKDHIQNGEVINSVSMKKMEESGEGLAGINDTFKQDIAGNGSKLTKPGNAAFGSDIQREASAYSGFVLGGCGDRCSPTFISTKDKQPSSGMAWLGDYRNAMTAIDSIYHRPEGPSKRSDAENLVQGLLDMAPDKDAAVEQMSRITIMDMVHNNTDRHVENLMVNEDFSDIQAIDHGYCFEPGLQSYKSKIHQGFNATGRHLKIPASVRERLEKTSYGDMRQAHGDHLQEWQIAQTYMRMQYVMHIADENDGNLPYDAFQGDYTKDRLIGNARFEDFMVDWIDTHSADPDSPHHAAAKRFDQVGVFVDPANVRAEPYVMMTRLGVGENYTYEQEVRSEKAAAEAYRNPGAPWVLAAKNKQDDMIEAINAPQLKEAKAKQDAAMRIYQDAQHEIFEFKRLNKDPNDEYWAMQEAIQPLAKKYKEARKEFVDLNTKTENLKTRERRMFNIVPEGFREKFDELEEKVNNAREDRRVGRRGARAYRMEPGKRVRSPAEIEKEKRHGAPEGFKAWQSEGNNADGATTERD